jgi:cytoskeleton protein RodZ
MSMAPTAGQWLKQARTRAGVHLAVLSVTLKVPVRQLEALEADIWDPTKGPVFYRGLASSVCRHLRIDPTPVLALLPSVSGQLAPRRITLHDHGISARSTRTNRLVWRGLVSAKVLSIAALMLLLTGALLWLPGPSQWTWLDDVKSLLGEEKISQEVVEPTAVFPPADPSSVAQQTQTSLVQANAPVAPTVQAALVPLAQPNSSTLAANSDVSVPATPRIGQTPEWVFSATGDSWLEVRNAQKAVVWSGVVKAGESTRIQTPLPVSVVVGRAQVVSVTLRGQPFDLKPHTQVAVARFEVKE